MVKRPLTYMNTQFIGTYYHTLEEKGRVSVPKQFRDGLEPGSVMTQGLDGCLVIYPLESWRALSDKLLSLPLSKKASRDFLRLITYNATVLEYDKLGRVRIPENLLTLAKLTKNIVFAGALTRVEVWDRQIYHDYLESLESKESYLEKALEGLEI